MAKKFNKVLALLLVAVMMVGLLPTTVFALDNQIVSDGQTVTTEDGKVQHSKMITQEGENAFRIDLTVKTKEDVDTQVVSQDAAVVLVLDTSNSMSSTDMSNARQAAKDFVTAFVKEAGEGKRMVSVVEFGSNGKTVLSWTNANGSQAAVNTGIDQVANKFSYDVMCEETGTHTHEETIRRNAPSVTPGQYKYWYCTACGSRVSKNWRNDPPALQDTMHDCKQEVSYTGTHVLRTENDGGGTNIEAGLRLANNLLEASAVGGISNKYVVLMTDGVPTYHVDDIDETDSTTFMKGSKGGGNEAYHDDYHDIYCTRNDQGWNHVAHGDNVPQQIKNQGAKLYTVSYKAANVTGNVNNMSIDSWLAAFATQNISAGDNIFSGLENIAQIIVNQAEAWILTDPMGQYINFVSGDGIAAVTNATADSSDAVKKFNTDTKTLTWDLKNDATRTGPVNGWYTYTMSYRITLDTAAEGFVAGQDYAANGTTTLTYMLTEDSQLQPDLESTNLVVPVVEGRVPVVAYTVEYYKWDKETKAYPTTPTDTVGPESGDLWETVHAPSGYETKYASDHYSFKDGDTQLILGLTGNVMKLYYMPDATKVTVNHFYKTDEYDIDGNLTKGSYGQTPNTTAEYDVFVGDSYTAEKQLSYAGATYEFDKGEDTIRELKEDASKNVINLYYTRVLDQRAEVNFVVNHVYRTHTWQVVDGSWKLVDSQSEVPNVQTGSQKAGTLYTAAHTPVTGNEGFTYDETSVDTITLKRNQDNVITLYFDKTVGQKGDPITVTVNHHYTKTVYSYENGVLVGHSDPDDHVETETYDKFVGESFRATEVNTYGNEFYTSAENNAQKLSIPALNQNNNTIDLYYSIQQYPDNTTVTVNHIYRTITTETVAVTDPITGEVTGTTTVEHTNEDSKDTVVSEAMYVGAPYEASLAEKSGYTFNATASDSRSINAKANNASVINLYYDKDAEADNRDAASIDVKHTYTTHLETIVDGEVKTIDVKDGEVVNQAATGKAGDSFTAQTETAYNGKNYTVVGTPELTKILQPGTNATIEIHYERNDRDLKETDYTVNYVYKTYTMTVDENGVAGYHTEPSIENGTPVSGTGYVDQKVTFGDGARDGFDPVGTAPSTTQILAADGNAWTFTYERHVPLAQVNVTVNHHYTTKTIALNGTPSSDTTHTNGAPVRKYVGETYVAETALNGFSLDRYTVTDGIANTQDADTKNVTVTASGDVVVDFYYSKTVDNSKRANYSIRHIYQTVDWDGTVTTLPEGTPVTGSGYVTTEVTATTNDQGGTYTLTSATYNGSDLASPYTITLIDGANEVVFTYQRRVDTREATVVTVNHHYRVSDSNVEAGYVPEGGVYTETFRTVAEGAYVGNTFTATLRETNNGKSYKFESADPEGYSKKLTADEAENVIDIFYLRDYTNEDLFDISGTKNFVGISENQIPKTTISLTQDGEVKYTAAVNADGTFQFTGVAPGLYGISESASVSGYSYKAMVELIPAEGGDAREISALVVSAGFNSALRITNTYTRNTPSGGYDYYRVTVNYVDKATGEKIADSFVSDSIREGRSWDVTDKQLDSITYGDVEYTFDSADGDSLKGDNIRNNKVVNLYYTGLTDIDEEPTPGGDKPTDIEDGQVPGDKPADTIDIVDGEVPMGDAPATGDTNYLGILLFLALASGLGMGALILSGKRSKKHN